MDDKHPQEDDGAWEVGSETSGHEDVSLARLSEAFAGMIGDEEELLEPKPPASLNHNEETAAATGEVARAGSDIESDRGEVTPQGIIESMLFVGHADNRPLTTTEMAGLIRGVEPAEVEQIIGALNSQYAASGCPYEITSEGAGYRMSLREEFQPVRDKFYARLKEIKLSQAAVEVLAVVAYHEPLTAEQVNEIRAAPSGAILSQLVRRQLLRIERPTAKAAPPHYFTTRRFLDLFGLETLSDLPRTPDVDQW